MTIARAFRAAFSVLTGSYWVGLRPTGLNPGHAMLLSDIGRAWPRWVIIVQSADWQTLCGVATLHQLITGVRV